MKQKYTIEKPSQEVLYYTIQNLPRFPKKMYIDFLADGVDIGVELQAVEKIEDYLQKCKEHNIIPFSRKEIKDKLEIIEKIPEHIAGAERFFDGKKTNDVLVNIFPDENESIIFKEILFPSLSKNNYKISHGYIILNNHKVGDRYDPDLEIKMDWGCEGLELMLDEEHFNEEKILRYKNWFNDLKKKFSI